MNDRQALYSWRHRHYMAMTLVDPALECTPQRLSVEVTTLIDIPIK
jgi:hypothetical protein